MKTPLAILCMASLAALLLALPAAAGNRPGWSDGPGCGAPGEGCAPGWTHHHDPLASPLGSLRNAGSEDKGYPGWSGPGGRPGWSGPGGYPGWSGAGGYPGWSGADLVWNGSDGNRGWHGPGGWSGPGGFPGWSGPGGFPGWTDPEVCTRIEDPAACDDHPVCRWHTGHQECVAR